MNNVKAFQWCVKNEITIYPIATGKQSMPIEINYKGTKHRTPVEYKIKDIYGQIEIFYQYYYDKHHGTN
jgi:hypothetical protein